MLYHVTFGFPVSRISSFKRNVVGRARSGSPRQTFQQTARICRNEAATGFPG